MAAAAAQVPALKRRKLSYSKKDKDAFQKFFQPPKRKVGRPRKKKRARRGKNAQKLQKRKTKKAGQRLIDMTVASSKKLTKAIDNKLAATNREPTTRINWDLPENAQYRSRCADSWENKDDLYVPGDSMSAFCFRNAIDRKVLSTFIKKRGAGILPKQRGRPTLLSQSVMKHLCESE